MESNRSKALWIVLAVLGLMLSTGLGALAGGAAGYWLGRRSVTQTETSTGLNLPQFLPEKTRVPPVQEAPEPLETPEPQDDWRRIPRLRSLLGATVSSVVEDSPADRAGIQEGDIITAVNGEGVGLQNDLRDVILSYEPGDTVEITLEREGEELTVQVTLGSQPEDSRSAFLGLTYVTFTPRAETEEPSY